MNPTNFKLFGRHQTQILELLALWFQPTTICTMTMNFNNFKWLNTYHKLSIHFVWILVQRVFWNMDMKYSIKPYSFGNTYGSPKIKQAKYSGLQLIKPCHVVVGWIDVMLDYPFPIVFKSLDTQFMQLCGNTSRVFWCLGGFGWRDVWSLV